MSKVYYLAFLWFLLSFSCNQTEKIDLILNDATRLTEQYPDSALFLLESVYYSHTLKENQYANYILLTVQAKDQAEKDISSDTLLLQVKDYFQKKGDLKKTVLAEFYSGKIFHSRQQYNEAMKAYLEAETTAQKTVDNNLKGLIQYFIGELCYDQQLHSEAIIRFKSAQEYFNRLPDNYKREIVTFNLIGNSFFIENKRRDSAFVYFDKALKLAEFHKDSAQIALIRQNLGVAFLEIQEIKQAKKQLFQALELASDTDIQTKIHLNLSRMYEKENQKDSSFYYAELSLYPYKGGDIKFSLLSTYRLLSRLEEKKCNYWNALRYYQQYVHYYDLIQKEKENANLLELQRKYDFELIKGANNRLIIQKQQILLLLILSLICVSIFVFYFYRRVRQDKEALSEAKQSIYQLKEMAGKENDSNRSFLTRQFDIVKKISLMEGYLMEEDRVKGKEILKKVNNIIYEKDSFDWNILYQPMNKLHNGYFDIIKNLFSNLSEIEYQICCLTKARLNNTEISIILKSNVNIIQMKKTAIRKKLEIPEQGDIVKFMDKTIDKTIEPNKKPL